jgi:S-formylglutathione hydrolase
MSPPPQRWHIVTADLSQGTGDNFYKQGQLLPENFANAAKEAGVDSGINIRFQPDYDHSYFTMASFADDHMDHAAKHLLK